MVTVIAGVVSPPGHQRYESAADEVRVTEPPLGQRMAAGGVTVGGAGLLNEIVIGADVAEHPLAPVIVSVYVPAVVVWILGVVAPLDHRYCAAEDVVKRLTVAPVQKPYDVGLSSLTRRPGAESSLRSPGSELYRFSATAVTTGLVGAGKTLTATGELLAWQPLASVTVTL